MTASCVVHDSGSSAKAVHFCPQSHSSCSIEAFPKKHFFSCIQHFMHCDVAIHVCNDFIYHLVRSFFVHLSNVCLNNVLLSLLLFYLRISRYLYICSFAVPLLRRLQVKNEAIVFTTLAFLRLALFSLCVHPYLNLCIFVSFDTLGDIHHG